MTVNYRKGQSLLNSKYALNKRSLKTKMFIAGILMLTLTVDLLSTAAVPNNAHYDPRFQSASTLLFKAEADARVEEHSPNTNAGTSDYLEAIHTNDRSVESYLRFTVSGISGAIQEARLRVYSTTDTSRNGPAVYATSNAWTETGITWNNRPERLSSASDNKDFTRRFSWVEYNVTPLVSGNGTYNFVLAGDSNDSVRFYSRESTNGPQLIITLGSGTPTPTSTPAATATRIASPTLSNELVLVGAGDIATCNREQDELTAQLLDDIPGTIFTLGDNAYRSGAYTEYVDCYSPSWGRHKARTKPVPGNHEYNTSEAAGYFQYFNDIPSYYAYDLGSWRIYALNSEIDVSLSSPQVVWLAADLLANPRQCALAYWHTPRWSSGSEHGSNSAMQTLWQILYRAGAEIVINGHDHDYERFAEMDESGKAVSPGLREFVVGTGGAGLYDFAPPLAASQVRNDTTYGVLKLTLRPGGYDWEFVPTSGSTFKDSGSGTCH